MGLFGKKKNEVVKLPELPEFEDDLGLELERDLSVRKPEVPSYDSPFLKENLSADAGPVMGRGPEKDKYDVPVRESSFARPKNIYEERSDSSHLDKVIPRGPPIQNSSPFKQERPPRVEEIAPAFKSVGSVDNQRREQIPIPKKFMDQRPVFVQIDDYRDAMNDIELMKQKVREVEYILDRLNEIKSQESLEISNCETSLEKIKEKLIGIDKKLFEI